MQGLCTRHRTWVPWTGVGSCLPEGNLGLAAQNRACAPWKWRLGRMLRPNLFLWRRHPGLWPGRLRRAWAALFLQVLAQTEWVVGRRARLSNGDGGQPDEGQAWVRLDLGLLHTQLLYICFGLHSRTRTSGSLTRAFGSACVCLPRCISSDERGVIFTCQNELT